MSYFIFLNTTNKIKKEEEKAQINQSYDMILECITLGKKGQLLE